MKKRLLSLLLTIVMVIGILPAQAFAAEQIPLTETEPSEELRDSGKFYLATATAELSEAEAGWYLLRVVRGGEALEEAEVRLDLVDITANYGRDYKVSLSNGGLFDPGVENADSSRSLMDQIMEEGVQEDLQQDLALAGMTEEQIAAALEEQAKGFTETLSEELSDYAQAHPERYLSQADGSETDNGVYTVEDDTVLIGATILDEPETVRIGEGLAPAPEETEEQDAATSPVNLSELYEAQTGLIDDWKPLSSDGSSLLDASSLIQDYSMDAVNEIIEGLNSACLDIPFAEGQTERTVVIRMIDDDEGQGNLLFMARLTAKSDNVCVDGERGRCLCTIADDEPYESPVVSFAEPSFAAAGGFVDVTIRREGVLTSVSSVHLTTSDGTALNGRDYSRVDADVSFPFGVSERTIHIPVRSDWLYDRAEFILKLSGGTGCAVGEIAEARGVIEADSESFVMTAAVPEDGEGELMAYTGGVRYGEPIDLSNWIGKIVGYGTGDAWMNGTSCQIKADSGGLRDDRARTQVTWDMDWYPKRVGENISQLRGQGFSTGIEYCGVSIKSSRTAGGDAETYVYPVYAWDTYGKHISRTQQMDGLTMGDHDAGWSSTEYRYYEPESEGRQDKGMSGVIIKNTKGRGGWTKQSTLTVEEIKPILRPFVVNVSIANPDALRYVDNQGNLVSYKDHDMAKSAGELVLGGANTGENTVVKYVNDYVEVTTPGYYSYIKSLVVYRLDDPNSYYTITPTYPVGNKTASFALDAYALEFFYNKNLLTFTKNPDGDGYVGNLNIQVMMGKIPTPVTLDDSDSRGSVALGFAVHNGTKVRGKMDDRDPHTVYRGDYVRFTQTLNESYQELYTSNSIRIRREWVTNSAEAGKADEGYEIFDRDQSAWQKTMFNTYAAITAYPSFVEKRNRILVKVKNSDLAKFDTASGIFTKTKVADADGYSYYEAVGPDDFAAHQYYTLTATPRDGNYLAIWYPANEKFGYSQNTYYYEAGAEANSNVIELNCGLAYSGYYTITGRAYHAGLDLLTGVEGESWQSADGVTVMVGPAAYAISDETGKFATIPFKGCAMRRVVVRVEAMGVVSYKTVSLPLPTSSVGKPIDVGGVTAREVMLGTFIVPRVNPNVPSVNAASLSDSQGVAIRTAAVWPEAISASQHQYTFTATVVHNPSTYTDTDGRVRTEQVKKVEFLAVDAATNEIRGELPGTPTAAYSGSSVTYSLKIGLDMSEDHLNIYRPGDKIYVRLTTDRVKGNGRSVDENGNELVDAQGRMWKLDDSGKRIPVTDADGNQMVTQAFLETVYAPVYTGYDLVSAANFTPPELNFKLAEKNMDDIFQKLPIFGSLNSTLNLSKLAVSQQELPNGGISLCIGFKLNTENNKQVKEFDSEFKGIGDAASKMMQWGKAMKSPPPMVVGVGKAGVNPFVGLYMDFGLDKNQSNQDMDYTFIAGGLYVGCVGFFKAVLYFPVGPIPVYFGTEGSLTGYLNFGLQTPDHAMTLNELSQAKDLSDPFDLDFKLKVQATLCLYVGVGLAGTLGVRGGMNLNMWYLYYPSVKNINPAYHEHGFTINLGLKIWVDAFFFSIPIPVMNLVNESYGYAADLKNGVTTASLMAGANDAPVMRQTAQPSEWLPGEGSLMSTLKPDFVTPLVNSNYPYASPQMIDTGHEIVLVFLTTESFFGTSAKGRGDEATLAYSLYQYKDQQGEDLPNPTWSQPQRIGADETLLTGDFQPNVILYRENDDPYLLVSWVSRKNESWAADPNNPTTAERLEYLRQMEIYSARCKVGDNMLTVSSVDRVTNDDFYNSEPQASWTHIYETGDTSKAKLFYLVSEPSEKSIEQDDPIYADFRNEESRQLLANLSPNQNGAFQMSKTYDNGSWTSATAFGDFVTSPVNGQNRPVITDFTVTPYVTDENPVTTVLLCAFTVDGDGNISTQYDTELYLQLYDLKSDKFYDPIQLTSNGNVAVSRPQFTQQDRANRYLFWYEAPDTTQEQYAYGKKNGDVKFLDINELFLYGLNIDESAGTCSIKNTVSINELKSRNPDAFNALEDTAGLTDYPYELPVRTVDMPDTEQFEDGPTVASFIPYLDNLNDLYIIWLQTMTHDRTAADGTQQRVQTNEIYAAARVLDDEESSETSNRWSMPVRLTNDEKFYDEATLVNVPWINRLVVTANRYAFALEDELSKATPVESADFIAVHFKDAGSVEATDIRYDADMPAAGETVGVNVTLRNTGLTALYAKSYEVYPLINGERGEKCAEGRDTEINKLLPGDTEEISFAYTMPESLSGLDEIGFEVVSREIEYVEDQADVRFEGEDAIPVGWRAELGEVRTEERSDGFYATFTLMNTGNVQMPAGVVCATASAADEDGALWASKTLDTALAPGEEVWYTVKLTDVADDFSTGFQRGFLTLTDAGGNDLVNEDSSRELILDITAPYNLTVNGDTALAAQGITLKAGSTLALSGTYEGTSFYPDGNVIFATEDSLVAVAEDGTLYAMEEGETALLAKVDAYGSTMSIPVKVTPGDPTPDEPDDPTPYVPSGPGSPTPSTITVEVSGDEGSVSVTAIVKDNTATITAPTEAQLAQITDRAGETGSVTIDLSSLPETVTAVSIPVETVKAVNEAMEAAGEGLTIKLPNSTVTFDAKALAAIAEQTTGTDLKLCVEPTAETKLNEKQRDAIAELDVQAVYDIYLISGRKRINDFGGGTALIEVAYTVKEDQQPGGIVVWYVADTGEKTDVPTTATQKTVKWTVTHFSNYVLAYDKTLPGACPKDDTCPMTAFTDLDKSSWYHDGVHWAIENGVMNGVGNDRFEPSGTTSRGMIVTMLYRMEGEPASDYAMTFRDVEDGKWYAEAVRWAADNGIVNGYSDDAFGPNDPVTREQIVTILLRYARYKGVDTEAGELKPLEGFDDTRDISDWAVKAFRWAVDAGIIQGTGGGKISPKLDASRAQVATMLMRYDAMTQ